MQRDDVLAAYVRQRESMCRTIGICCATRSWEFLPLSLAKLTEPLVTRIFERDTSADLAKLKALVEARS